MDFRKIHNEFENAMLPYFEKSDFNFIGGDLYFRIEAHGLNVEWKTNFREFERDVYPIGMHAYFGRLKDYFASKLLESMPIDYNTLERNYLNYVDNCKKNDVPVIKSMYEFLLSYELKIPYSVVARTH